MLSPIPNQLVQPIHILPTLPPVPNETRRPVLQAPHVVQVDEMPIHRMERRRVPQTRNIVPRGILDGRTGEVDTASRVVVFDKNERNQVAQGGLDCNAYFGRD